MKKKNVVIFCHSHFTFADVIAVNRALPHFELHAIFKSLCYDLFLQIEWGDCHFSKDILRASRFEYAIMKKIGLSHLSIISTWQRYTGSCYKFKNLLIHLKVDNDCYISFKHHDENTFFSPIKLWTTTDEKSVQISIKTQFTQIVKIIHNIHWYTLNNSFTAHSLNPYIERRTKAENANRTN